MNNQWIFGSIDPPPAWLIERAGTYGAQVLWCRGFNQPEAVDRFLNMEVYQPTPATAFGEEMEWAVERLQVAHQKAERVLIWGDFDSDGITATAVLMEGLRPFFDHLNFFIPNRLTENHGLSISGIDRLKDSCDLIITCDTGSANLAEIAYLQQLGIDLIITDHHTHPPTRPPATAIINPRYLPDNHPLYHLSGVAVAYKLLEAYYAEMKYPPAELENLLDLVAIGLIADLVKLTDDCRYLAKQGLEVFKRRQRQGLKELLEACNTEGNSPTDISFGVAPRLNAISRIWGDVRQCVELLTSKDSKRCRALVKLTETANQKRKDLQKIMISQAEKQINRIDLSTTGVIVVIDPEWSVGLLGLVASALAKKYHRPAIVGTIQAEIVRASARSYGEVDLYALMQGQEHLLLSMGGHPHAGGLSLKLEHLQVFTNVINHNFHHQYPHYDPTPKITIDLELTLKDFNQKLHEELKPLQPFGMGNPAPVILVRNAIFIQKPPVDNWSTPELSLNGNGTQIKCTNWQQLELPDRPCDVLVEFVYNFKNREYQACLIDWQSAQFSPTQKSAPKSTPKLPTVLDREISSLPSAQQIWQKLIGIAKYLARTGTAITITELASHLGLDDRLLLNQAIATLASTPLIPQVWGEEVKIQLQPSREPTKADLQTIHNCFAMLEEYCFRAKNKQPTS